MKVDVHELVARIDQLEKVVRLQASGSRSLRVAVAEPVAVFRIDRRRSRKALEALEGEFEGVFTTNHHAANTGRELALCQYCWSHLLRDFNALGERGGRLGKVGKALAELGRLMFWLARGGRAGPLKALLTSSLSGFFDKIRQGVKFGFQKGKALSNAPALLEDEEALWRWMDRPEVDWTNNCAERAVRFGVIWRKISHGFESPRGARFIERILTAGHTLDRQGRSLFDFAHCARLAAIKGETPPALLPQPLPTD